MLFLSVFLFCQEIIKDVLQEIIKPDTDKKEEAEKAEGETEGEEKGEGDSKETEGEKTEEEKKKVPKVLKHFNGLWCSNLSLWAVYYVLTNMEYKLTLSD